MNIFVLDDEPFMAARYHCNKHLVKMITEHNQILGSIAYTSRGIKKKSEISEKFIKENFQGFPRSLPDGTPHPYGIGFKNHPCTKWAAESEENYRWLCKLNVYLCQEYQERYNKEHAGEKITRWYYGNRPKLPEIGMTPFAQAMPEECKDPDPVKAYRKYYIKYKSRFAKWPADRIPDWWPTELVNG